MLEGLGDGLELFKLGQLVSRDVPRGSLGPLLLRVLKYSCARVGRKVRPSPMTSTCNRATPQSHR